MASFRLEFYAVHKLDVPPDHRRDYWSDLIAGAFFKVDSRIRNLSKFRLAYRMWIRTMEKLNYPGVSSVLANCINETHGLLNLGNWKDYLDGDLVHAAAYGVEDCGNQIDRKILLSDERRHRHRLADRIPAYSGGGISSCRSGFPRRSWAAGCVVVSLSWQWSLLWLDLQSLGFCGLELSFVEAEESFRT